jgi:predicted kinase
VRARQLSYEDAVKILSGADSRMVAVAGRLAGVAAGVATTASGGTVDFFALRDEAVRWGHAAASELAQRASGLRRLDRTDRLLAAHAVLVVTAFFDAVGEVVDGKVDRALDSADISETARIGFLAGSTSTSARMGRLHDLIAANLPMPEPHRPLEEVCADLHRLYTSAARDVLDFLRGLAGFEPVVDAVAAGGIADIGLRRYLEAYRATATSVPEFAVWASMVESHATRTVIGEKSQEIRTELGELLGDHRLLVQRLTSFSAVGTADEVARGLVRRHEESLLRPILVAAQAPAHVVLPSLVDAYVYPGGQVRVAGPSDLPGTERWWAGAADLDDVHTFLVAHLVGPSAVRGPLVILGQPGSGKSVLTRVLAASLGHRDLLPVRVELRTVAADTSIQTQVETALYKALGEQITWPQLVRRFPDCLPVLMLDGFDELLQATGVNRADYLELVQEFQRREAELGRPVAVIVTSRTVVAHRARFPQGSVVVRLKPFNDDQVRDWLSVWNAVNADGLSIRSLRTLTADVALRHGELARQPLLLLLLALYDAGSNALQRNRGEIDEVDLYERLFTDFIRREINKNGRASSDEEDAVEAQREWRRLSSVAIAMLNRGTEVLTEAQLDADVPPLLGPDGLLSTSSELGSQPLTPGQLLVGRFFFIHESVAARDTSGPTRSFEFLHATFGEYLAARLIVEGLVDLAEERVHQRRRQGRLDGGFLYATTSFVTIARRAPLFDFCRGLISRLSPETKTRCGDLLLELLDGAGYPHPTWSLAEYEPRRKSMAARQAAYSANLICLIVLLLDGPVEASLLVGEPALNNWQQLALLLFGQLDPEDRQRVWQVLRVRWRDGHLMVGLEDGSPVSMYESLPWRPDVPPTGSTGPSLELTPDLTTPSETHLGRALRKSAFVQTAIEVREYLYLVAPYWRAVGDLTWTGPGAQVLDAHVLLRLLVEPYDGADPQERFRLFEAALTSSTSPAYRRLVLEQLQTEFPTLWPENLYDLLRLLHPGERALGARYPGSGSAADR